MMQETFFAAFIVFYFTCANASKGSDAHSPTEAVFGVLRCVHISEGKVG